MKTSLLRPGRSPGSQRIRASAFTRLFGLFLPFPLLVGFPAAHALVAGGTSAVVEVADVERTRKTWTRGCNWTARVTLPGAERPAKVCGVPPDTSEALEPGDRLLLSGFRYEAISPP